MRRRRRRGGEPAPSFFQSLHKERQLPLEHEGEPQLPADGPSQKDPAPNGCLSTLLVKIILHIFCMSLTVSIKPRPFDSEGEEDFCCGFPHGHGEEEAGEARGRPRRNPALLRLRQQPLPANQSSGSHSPANQSSGGLLPASQSSARQLCQPMGEQAWRRGRGAAGPVQSSSCFAVWYFLESMLQFLF